MSDMFYEDGNYEPRETNAMRALREKAEADSKKISELTDQLQELSREVSTSRVERVVTSKGYDPRVAALAASAGVKADADAVEAWLKDFGDVFAKVGDVESPVTESSETEGEQTTVSTTVPAEEQVALAAAAAATSGATPATGLAATEAQLANAQDEAAVLEILAALKRG